VNPLVSIIIPTYNRAHLLTEVLDSILSQSYAYWECIVVDDGSKDETSQLLNKYIVKDVRFKYYQRPPTLPKGANACRNYGFQKSNGNYIQWFDSDDVMHSEKLKIKVRYALEYDADIMIDKHTTSDDIILLKNPKLELFESEVFHIDYIMGIKPVITNDVMVKKKIIGEHRFDEKLHKAQEYEFFGRLFNQKLKYCFLDQPLTIYKETQDSISKSTSRGNNKQAESLIYLSKLLKERHRDNLFIVANTEKQGRKTYKNLVQNGNLKLLFKHFSFFKESHYKSSIVFFCLFDL
jgi:glycosyltransferase involved in cell wall biosynthesis